MTDSYDVVIVGSGHAGAQTAITLRQNGFKGSIALVGEECHLPYERPPLSKAYLRGDLSFEQILIRPPQFWSEQRVSLLLGQRATSVDPIRRRLSSDGFPDLNYGKLVWAAGGTARRLGCVGEDLAGVHRVRSYGDILKLKAEIEGIRRVVIVGGGYIGLEAAAVLRKLGREVILLEALDRVLARVAGEPISRFYEAEHARHGVKIRLNTCVEAIAGRSGRVSNVILAGGEKIDCDLVIVGIGIVPIVAPLLEAGAAGGNGVAVDTQCRTSLPDVFAVGDCALHVNPHAGPAPIRLESVQNANDMAVVVAKTILGMPAAYDALPWFWSDQFDLQLQTAGLSSGYDYAILRGTPASRSFSLVYLRDNQVIALDCINATADFVQGRMLVSKGSSPPPSMIANSNIPLRKTLEK